MNLEKMYKEEDLFPREIASVEEREYGYLFYDAENRDSYDSNHAVIFREQVKDLDAVLTDIVKFYRDKGLKAIIYQSITDEGYFEEIKGVLSEYGFDSWTEEQKYMVLSEKNSIRANPEVTVQKVAEWKDEYGTEIFEKAEEPWEIPVAKKVIAKDNTLFFIASYRGKPVGMMHAHEREGVCRFDYLLVSKEARNMGVGRAIVNYFVHYCKENQVHDNFLWPDGDTPEKIYYEAGYRYVETKNAGRAVYR